MTIWPESQMDKIDDRRRAGNLSKRKGVACGCGMQIGYIHRHGTDLLWTHRTMLAKGFTQMG